MITTTLKNGNIIELTPLAGKISLVADIPEGTASFDSLDTANRRLNFSFISKKNVRLKLANLKIIVKSGSLFSKAPSVVKTLESLGLENNSSLNTVLKSKSQDENGNITSYYYDLFFKPVEDLTLSNVLRYSINSDDTALIPYKSSGITRVSFGKSEISLRGEKRRIIAYGTPGDKVEIAITKLIDFYDTANTDLIVNSKEEDIFDEGIKGKTYVFNGVEINTLVKTIGVNGKVGFTQTFPPASSNCRYTINVKKIFVDTNVFKNKRWIENRHGWENYYSNILYQYPVRALTIRLTTSLGAGVTNVKLNTQNATTFNNTTPHEFVLYSNSNTNVYYATYTLTRLSGTWNKRTWGSAGGAISFTNGLGGSEDTNNVYGLPMFSHSTQSSSDFTNSDFTSNGGTKLDVVCQTEEANLLTSGNTIATLKFKINIIQWGTKNVTMNWSIDSVVS